MKLQANQDGRLYGVTVLYMVFKTIEANPNITINQLKHLLKQEYFIPYNVIQGCLATLTSASLYGCVTKFKKSNDSIEKTHLHAKPEHKLPKVFTEWKQSLENDLPELLVFTSPKLSGRSDDSKHEQ